MPMLLSTTKQSAAEAISAACGQLAAGKHLILVDDLRRHGEAVMVLAGSHATTESIAYMVRHTSGLLRVALPQRVGERLQLQPMQCRSTEPHGTDYCVSVDSVETTTGISAADRARTISDLANSDTTHTDLIRPGHVIPVLARPGGVSELPGRAESIVDLMNRALLPPAGVYAEIITEDGTGDVAKGRPLTAFARSQGLPVLTISNLFHARGSR